MTGIDSEISKEWSLHVDISVWLKSQTTCIFDGLIGNVLLLRPVRLPNVAICLSVCPLAQLETVRPNFTIFFVLRMLFVPSVL